MSTNDERDCSDSYNGSGGDGGDDDSDKYPTITITTAIIIKDSSVADWERERKEGRERERKIKRELYVRERE